MRSGKAQRLCKYCKGWSGQKYTRKLASKARRRFEKLQINAGSEDVWTPRVLASGWAD